MAKKFNLGDKVFAKVRGYPPWPAKVTLVMYYCVTVLRKLCNSHIYFFILCSLLSL